MVSGRAFFMVLSNFWLRILYMTFNGDTFVFLTENLGHLTLIDEKHLNYLPVDSFSLHNLGIFVNFVEPCLIILKAVRLDRIYPRLLTYHDLILPIRVTLSIHNLKIRSLYHFGYIFA